MGGYPHLFCRKDNHNQPFKFYCFYINTHIISDQWSAGCQSGDTEETWGCTSFVWLSAPRLTNLVARGHKPWNIAAHQKRHAARYHISVTAVRRLHARLLVNNFESFLQLRVISVVKELGLSLSVLLRFSYLPFPIENSDSVLLHVVCSLLLQRKLTRFDCEFHMRNHYLLIRNESRISLPSETSFLNVLPIYHSDASANIHYQPTQLL